MTANIVFTDARVTGYKSLLSGIDPLAEVYLVDDSCDGLDQIALHLQGRSGIDAIHLISHGSSGSVSLGSSVVDGAAINVSRAER